MRSVRFFHIALPLVMGLVLGLTAFLVDEFDGALADLVSPVVSSSFSWGAAAVVAGYVAPSIRQAVIGAVSVLAVASAAYYSFILLWSRRWALGEVEDGGSITYVGVLSVGRAWSLWLVLAGCAGLVLGLLGKQLASGAGHQRSVAAGIIAGLLAAEAVYTSLFLLPHRIISEPLSFVLWPVTAVLAIGGAAYSLHTKVRGLWRSFGVSSGVSLIVMTVLWSVVAGIRTAL